MKDYVIFATDLARKAGTIITENLSLGMKKELKKKDNSPFTASDVFINNMVIEEIAREYPEHSVIGEEKSNERDSDYVWVCDPIDGTIPFSSGIPISSFSLALTKNGIPIIGVIYDPFMDRLFVAEKGRGACLNNEKIFITQENTLKNQPVYMGWWKHSLYDLSLLRGNLSKRGIKIMDFCSFAYAGALVAAGEFSGIIFGDRYPWDVAAMKVIIEEAGGKCTDFTGENQRYDEETNGFVAGNVSVHSELLNLVKKFAVKN